VFPRESGRTPIGPLVKPGTALSGPVTNAVTCGATDMSKTRQTTGDEGPNISVYVVYVENPATAGNMDLLDARPWVFVAAKVPARRYQSSVSAGLSHRVSSPIL